MIEVVDSLLRGAILCVLSVFILAIVDNRELRRTTIGFCAIAFCFTFGLHLFATSQVFPDPTSPIRLGFRLIEAPNFALFWLFLLMLFEDGFQLKAWHIAVLIVFTGIMAVERIAEAGLMTLPPQTQILFLASSVGLIAHASWVLLRGWNGDLIARRRGARFFVLAAVLFGALMSTLGTNSASAFNSQTYKIIAMAADITVLLLVAREWLKLNPENFLPYPKTTFGKDTADAVLTVKQNSSLEALTSMMTEGQVYLQSDLTIGKLARDIGLGEHALRTLINKKIGYRNFPTFLNSYRIKHAKDLLSDPTRADEPVYSIAIESGFNSLSVFNRAFRDDVGITPTAYRKDALQAPATQRALES